MAETAKRVSIRPALAADRDRFLALWADFAQNGPEPCAPDAGASNFAHAVAGARGIGLLLAEEAGGTVCGFALYLTFPWSWSARDAAYLLDLYVAPDRRRRGIAAALLDRLAEEGRARGWLKVFWMTQADNVAARAAYDRVAAVSPLVRYDMVLNPHER